MPLFPIPSFSLANGGCLSPHKVKQEEQAFSFGGQWQKCRTASRDDIAPVANRDETRKWMGVHQGRVTAEREKRSSRPFLSLFSLVFLGVHLFLQNCVWGPQADESLFLFTLHERIASIPAVLQGVIPVSEKETWPLVSRGCRCPGQSPFWSRLFHLAIACTEFGQMTHEMTLSFFCPFGRDIVSHFLLLPPAPPPRGAKSLVVDPFYRFCLVQGSEVTPKDCGIWVCGVVISNSTVVLSSSGVVFLFICNPEYVKSVENLCKSSNETPEEFTSRDSNEVVCGTDCSQLWEEEGSQYFLFLQLVFASLGLSGRFFTCHGV